MPVSGLAARRNVMDLNRFDIEKSGILFFDILKGYYHEASEQAKARKKPMVDGAVRLMKAGREARIPIFFAKGNHRSDTATSVLLLTDTKYDLTPWPNGIPTKDVPVAVAGKSGAEVIPELDPRPDD
jgi:nicotinamidase-related amidase